ncbi:flagellar motor switch protein FliN [Salmonella enterica subsp. enterica]|uniref:Flagellar motor switch protein FliN n=1 Tax=Salmonella enterica I TaxID=59201 RepID=A0A447N8J8_SALET|nr:flagellar motor switch protein FliN [Salmonella enterica subsp. enterica]
MSDMNNPSDENTGALDDLWADALNEQKATTTKSAADAVSNSLAAAMSAVLCRISI